MSPVEMTLLAFGIWVTPAILLSTFVVYQSRKRDWRETTTVAWTGRPYGDMAMAQPAMRSTGRLQYQGRTDDRAGVQHGKPFSDQQFFPRKQAKAEPNRIVAQQCMVAPQTDNMGAQMRVSFLVVGENGSCSSDEWMSYLN